VPALPPSATPGSRLPETLVDLFRIGAERYPRPDRFLQKSGGLYRPVSTEEFVRRVHACAGALAGAGVEPGDRVAILSYNRVEWAIADFACLWRGAVDVPIYSTLPADQVAYILRDAGVKAMFVENAEQLAKVAGLVPRVVAFEAAPGAESFEDFLRRGRELPPHAADPEELATILYTSGTTGVPKGVMLTHRNVVSNLIASCAVLTPSPEDLALSFLPLSHSFERILDYAYYWSGTPIAYAEHVDKVAENMRELRPTILGAVPRVYEKLYARILKSVQEMSPRKRALFEWARGVGALGAELRRRGERAPWSLRWRLWLAGRLVLGKIAERAGGRIRYFISGGGALARDIAEFLFSLGFTVLEGYGLTETSPVLTLNAPGRTRLGTVGQAIPGVELRIAPDGEILARGPNIMKGYLNRPEETAQAIQDGWFATGDIGELDAEGYLKITDRKKDLLKTSGGKYIAPQPIENRLKLSPRIHNAVVIGDRRKFPAALIVPARGATRQEIQADVDALNVTLAHHEQIKKFALLDRDFTLEGGEITPTQKVKRRVIEKNFQKEICDLYAE
jgi:long-chain acyl-CoA synthetase